MPKNESRLTSPMKWFVHPAKDNRLKTIISLIFIIGFLVFISLFYGLFWGVFAFAILFFSLHSYFFPTYYEVDKDRVTIKNIFTTQRRQLGEFRRIYQGRNGVLLSPFKHKTFLNQFRGIFLLLPQKREEIVSYLMDLFRASDNNPTQDANENNRNGNSKQ